MRLASASVSRGNCAASFVRRGFLDFVVALRGLTQNALEHAARAFGRGLLLLRRLFGDGSFGVLLGRRPAGRRR